MEDAVAVILFAAITAYARSDDAMRALAAGYQRHAPKPIQPTTLAALVAGLANMHSIDA